MLDLEITDQDIRSLERTEGLKFDLERSKILKSLESIDIQACPGSGKTTLIAAKLILLSKKWSYRNRGICVLSHTNVAKNEIIRKIETSNIGEARNLLSYPHFIGTIQEFVGKFLALPILRSEDRRCRLLNGNEFHEEAIKISWPKIQMTDGTRKDPRSLVHSKKLHFGNFSYEWNLENQELVINNNFCERFYKNIKQTEYPLSKLIEKKKLLSKQEVFLYRDMYALSDYLLSKCDVTSKAIQQRYPLVFIDEMQDTQKFQDDLLQRIFPLSSTSTVVQRFGDPDQAIFNDMNDEIPNESYNGKSRSSMSFVIDKSHRFNTDIGQKIKGLSFNEIELDTDLSDADIKKMNRNQSNAKTFKHTVFIYNDETIGRILPEFAKLVDDQFCYDIKNTASFSVKAIGAVGNEIDKQGQLKIGHYWQGFDKTKSQKNFKENCFIEAVHFVRQKTEGEWSESYKYLNDCILRSLRLAGVKDEDEKTVNATSLKKRLTNNKNWYRYRRVLFWLINNNNPLTEIKWQKISNILKRLLGISTSEYFAYKQCLLLQSVNLVNHNSPIFEGIKIELSTIHAVKGETHDATLILETRHYNHDLHVMLPYITGEKPNISSPNSSLKPDPSNAKDVAKMPNQKFMRQLYVAMSRPKHLLCFAIHKTHITEDQINALKSQEKGWNIIPLHSAKNQS